MIRSDLLILYCPGSRGDFLAAILTDLIDQCYDQFAMDGLDLHYNKMHGVDEGNNPWDNSLNESSILQNRSQSIRIKIAPKDYDFIAQLATNKDLKAIVDGNDVAKWENRYRKLDIKFGHVVWFADLFDVKFLQSFYQRFNGRAMPEHYVPMIEHNIQLQLNYKPEHHTTLQSGQRQIDR